MADAVYSDHIDIVYNVYTLCFVYLLYIAIHDWFRSERIMRFWLVRLSEELVRLLGAPTNQHTSQVDLVMREINLSLTSSRQAL